MYEDRQIDDAMIPELCEWLAKLDGKVEKVE